MKKSLALVLSLIMVFTLLVGCGKSETVDTDTTKSETTEAVTEAEKKADPVKAELSVMMSISRYTEQMEGYFAQFKEKMLAEKNMDVTINLEMPSADQYGQILQTRLASGEAPDLFTLHATQDIPTYYKAGYLLDMTSQPFVGTLYEGVRPTVTYDSKVLAVPMESLAWGYLYNKDIFDAAGVTAPDTIDEMKQVVQGLKDKGYTPFELAFQESWVPQLMTALSLGGLVSGQIPDWVERMYADNGSYTEVAGIFEIIDIIMENGTDRPFETGFDQGAADFANGKAAMWVNGTWATESILNANPDIKIGVGALPVNDDPNSAMVNLSTSTSLAVYSGTKQAELALELANYMLDAEDSSALFQSMLFNPVATVHNYDQFSWTEEAYSYVEQGRAYIDLVLPNSVTGEQAALLQEYYLKTVTQEEFLSQLDATFKEANKVANDK